MTSAETKRRRLLRGLFIALCVIPALGIAAWASSLKTYGHRLAWESQFGSLLGLRIVIDDVRYPRPGVVLFETIRAYDPETDALVFQCRSLEAEKFSDGRHLRAVQAELHADRAVRLYDMLERGLRREMPELDATTSFAAGEFTWRTGDEAQTLVDVEALVGPVESGRQLLLNFRLPDAQTEHPVSLRIARSTTSEPTTSIEFDTGAVMLPTSMFAPLSELAAALGPEARYSGRLKVRRTPEGWDGVVTGDVVEADLDQLVSRRLPHTLTGPCELRIHRAELARGRLERAHLTVLAGPGQISRSLIASAGVHLALVDPGSALPTETMLLYDRLAFDATWDSGSLVLKGRTPNRPGEILWTDRLVLWREPRGVPLSAANVLRAVLPDRELLVPAAAQTASLLQWLPFGPTAKRDPPPATTNDSATPTLPKATRLRVRTDPGTDETEGK